MPDTELTTDHLPVDIGEGRGAEPRPLLNMSRSSLLAVAAQLEAAAADIRLLAESDAPAADAPRLNDPRDVDWLTVQWPPHPGLCDFSDRVTWCSVGEAQGLLHLRSDSAIRDRIRRRPVAVKVGGVWHVNIVRLLSRSGSLPGEDQ